ncbi:MAG: DUF4395 domain-containing protein [Deltaproteobacteria bacterium]
MKNIESCPVELKSINKKIVRANAFVVFLFVTLFLITQSTLIIGFIAIDFFIKVFFGARYSPVSIINCFFIRKAKLKPQMIDAGPKIFAARIGLVLSILIVIFHLTGLYIPSLVFTLFLMSASSLEAFFDICLACLIYPWFSKLLN